MSTVLLLQLHKFEVSFAILQRQVVDNALIQLISHSSTMRSRSSWTTLILVVCNVA